MKNECFLDTNILIYAATKSDGNPKSRIASGIIASSEFCLSSQVLAEFFVNARKKIKPSLTLVECEQWINVLSEFPVLAVDVDVVRAGIANSERFQISYWDGAIIAAAERLEAPVVYSEDMNHGQEYGPVTVVNPFKAI